MTKITPTSILKESIMVVFFTCSFKTIGQRAFISRFDIITLVLKWSTRTLPVLAMSLYLIFIYLEPLEILLFLEGIIIAKLLLQNFNSLKMELTTLCIEMKNFNHKAWVVTPLQTNSTCITKDTTIKLSISNIISNGKKWASETFQNFHHKIKYSI